MASTHRAWEMVAGAAILTCPRHTTMRGPQLRARPQTVGMLMVTGGSLYPKQRAVLARQSCAQEYVRALAPAFKHPLLTCALMHTCA